MMEVIVHDSLQLGIRNVLDFAVLYELGQCGVEDALCALIAGLIISWSVGEWDE